MKKIIGLLLIIFGIFIIGFFIYTNFIAKDSGMSLFTLFVPAMFIFQGLEYLKKPYLITNTIPNIGTEVSEAQGPAFDPIKRTKLINKLKAMDGDTLIPIEEFLDGNINDLGSIGCNLYPEHPGIELFASVFRHLLSRQDVYAIYASISEIEPDEESWPYTDKVYILGTIPEEVLKRKVEPIQPTEVGLPPKIYGSIKKKITDLNAGPVKMLWWD